MGMPPASDSAAVDKFLREVFNPPIRAYGYYARLGRCGALNRVTEFGQLLIGERDEYKL